jgi:two-component system, chemotaxis family, chemotaxis protein CheY
METKKIAVKPAVGDMRILVADDQLAMRELLKTILRTLRIENITLVGDGAQAIGCYRKTPYDMVFLDIEMPEQDGFAVLRQIRELDSQAFVVMVTGHSAVDNVKQAMELGAQGFVVKPYTSTKIADMLKKFRDKP